MTVDKNSLSGYYDRYDASKGYKEILFIAGKGAQASEVNELQGRVFREVRNMGVSAYQSNTFTSGGGVMASVISGNLTAVCDGGVFFDGEIFHEAQAATLAVPIANTDTLVIAISKSIITEVEDTDLRSIAVGMKNFGQPGAARMKYVVAWYKGSTAPVSTATTDVTKIIVGDFTAGVYSNRPINIESKKTVDRPLGEVGTGTDLLWYKAFTWTLPTQYANFQAQFRVNGRSATELQYDISARAELGTIDFTTFGMSITTPYGMVDGDQFKLVCDFATKTVSLYYKRGSSTVNVREIVLVANTLNGGGTLVYENSNEGATEPTGGQETAIVNNATCLLTVTEGNYTHTGEVTGNHALTIAAKAVTLAKMGDVATASVFYRKTAGTGAPEVNTLATLKTDLGLDGLAEAGTTTPVEIGATGANTSLNWYLIGTWNLNGAWRWFETHFRVIGRGGNNVLYDLLARADRDGVGASDFTSGDLKLITPLTIYGGDEFRLIGDWITKEVRLYYCRTTDDWSNRGLNVITNYMNGGATYTPSNTLLGTTAPTGTTISVIQNISNCVSLAGISGGGTMTMLLTGTRLDITNPNDPSYVFGGELFGAGGWSSMDWTGSFVTGWTHTIGDSASLLNSYAATISKVYHITFTITGRTAGTVTINFGGENSAIYTDSGEWNLTASTTGTFAMTPTSTFDGTVSLSLKEFA